MARVQLDQIRKVYDNGFTAVHDATFTIEDGEFVVLVGPSGCGKSTTLRMIAGLEGISSGTVRIGDRVVNDVPPKDRDIAMVFQNYALYPHMNVFDNMAFGLKLRKFSKDEIQERVQRAASILGIEGILDSKPRQLSGGQRQRVALGRAIVRKPQVFLFDEPLSNLDAKLRVQTRTEISKLHRHLAATMIYVTHDQVEAMTMGDRIVVLKDGFVQQIAPPLTLYNQPANRFVAGFIGSPAMNFLDGAIESTGGGYVFIAEGLRLTLPDRPEWQLAHSHGRPVSLGIRPEDIEVAHDQDAYDGNAALFQLDVLEPMGHEVVLYASSGAHNLVARVEPQPLPEPGQSISLGFDSSRFHLFDLQTGETLTATSEEVAV